MHAPCRACHDAQRLLAIAARTAVHWVNGVAQADVSAQDRGLCYGDGVFETCAVRNGIPLLWDRHIARLTHACTRLGMPMPDPERLFSEAFHASAGQSRAVLKIIVTRGVGTRGYMPEDAAVPTRIVMQAPWPDYPARYSVWGVEAGLCEMRLGHNPRLAGIKHLNRLEQVLARAELRAPGYAEGVMRDGDGCIIEGTMSNLFAVQGGVLWTADLSRCGVAGVMRAEILAHAEALNVPCRIESWPLDRLLQADEAFFCNSLIGIWPLRRLLDRHYPLGTLTQRLMQAIVGMH